MGRENGVAQTEWCFLLDKTQVHKLCQAPYQLVCVRQMTFLKVGFEAGIATKMRWDWSFVVSYDQNRRLDSACGGFLPRILNKRLACNRKHFLGDDLGCGQHPRAEARGGDHHLHD